MTDMQMEKIIQMVLAELAKQNKSRNQLPTKKVLTVFSAGIIGLDEALGQMQELQKNGYQFEAVLTPNAKKVIGINKLQEFLGQINIYDDCQDFNKLTDLLTDTDGVLIPVMTMNMAAKVANGIADNLATTIIMISLLSGKEVIAVKDACNLSHFSCHGMEHNKAFKAYELLLMSNVERLADYGIVLCAALDLAGKVKECLDIPQRVSTAENGNESQIYHQNILSLADLPSDGGKFHISPQTIITPAAKDAIKEREIEIIIG